MSQMANGYRHNLDSILIMYKFVISTSRVVIEILNYMIYCVQFLFFWSINMLLILAVFVALKGSAEQVPLSFWLAILTKTHTPPVPKWLSVFLTLARLRPAHHWVNSCKYDSQYRKEQLLQNAPGSCSAKSLLDTESLVRKYLTVSLKIIAGQKPDNHFGKEGVSKLFNTSLHEDRQMKLRSPGSQKTYETKSIEMETRLIPKTERVHSWDKRLISTTYKSIPFAIVTMSNDIVIRFNISQMSGHWSLFDECRCMMEVQETENSSTIKLESVY